MKQFILKHYGKFLAGVVLLVAILAINDSVNKRKQIQNLKAEKVLLIHSIDTFRNKNSQLISQAEAAKVANDKAVTELSNEIFDLKRKNQKLVKEIQSLGRIGQRVRVDSVLIPYTDTFYVINDSTIRVPAPYEFDDKWFSLKGKVLKTGVLVDSISISDTLSFRQVDVKNGWFKKPTTVLQVVHSNPYVQTTSVQYIVVDRPTTQWNKWIKPTLTALGAGFITYKLVK